MRRLYLCQVIARECDRRLVVERFFLECAKRLVPPFPGRIRGECASNRYCCSRERRPERNNLHKPLFSFFPLATLTAGRAAHGRGSRYAAAHLAGCQFNGGIVRVGAGVRRNHRAGFSIAGCTQQAGSAAERRFAEFGSFPGGHFSFLAESPSCIAIASSGLRSSNCSW